MTLESPVWRLGPSWFQVWPDLSSDPWMTGCWECWGCWLRWWWLLMTEWWQVYLASAAPDVSKTKMVEHIRSLERWSTSQWGCCPTACVCTVLLPAEQQVWPVSADSPNGLWHPLLSWECCQSLRGQDPVPSPSLSCNIEEKRNNQVNQCSIKTMQYCQKRLPLRFSPFCKGPDLPQLQVFFRHPRLHSNRPSQLGWLLLLGPQGAWSQAFPLWCGGFYSSETWKNLVIICIKHYQIARMHGHGQLQNQASSVSKRFYLSECLCSQGDRWSSWCSTQSGCRKVPRLSVW